MIYLKIDSLVFSIFLFVAFNFFSQKVLANNKLKEADCPKPFSLCNVDKNGFINVHIVPHTHDDVGWLKTVDQYYYGSYNHSRQKAAVQYILDTVVDELLKDPARRFVYVEMAFFYLWWNEQTNATKQSVRSLVNEGRLEFVIGAWCMNDEATTYYTDIIDQQTLGLRFILKEFGECARPRSAWQIDPFGHSREQASLFAQFGFDGLFHGRIDYQDFDFRGDTKTREFLWQASQNLDETAQLFTGILHNGYSSPPGFCFDATCNDDPIMDDPTLDEYNVDSKVDEFIQFTLSQHQKYATDSLIMTMGSDFQYSNAHMWFKNLDKLIYYVNQRQITNGSKVNVFYSTPSCYVKALNEANKTWSVKYDDFFPYANKPHAFWTGYFTSRPALKYYVRIAGNYLQTFRKLTAFYRFDHNPLDSLDRAMGVVQHHDAVSGTERQHVTYDYAKRLSIGIQSGLSILTSLAELTETNSQFELCSFNISECLATENVPAFFFSIYNPLSHPVEAWFRFPVLYDDYKIVDFAREKMIDTETVRIDEETRKIPERKSKSIYSLVFKLNMQAQDSIGLFSSRFSPKQPNKMEEIKMRGIKMEPFTLKNAYLAYSFDKNGNLKKLENLELAISTPLEQFFCFYESMIGNNSEPEFQPSGAYVFRPVNDSCVQFSVRNYTLYQGKMFSQIHQVYNDWISQTIRLYENARYAEFEWQIGPINIDDEIGKEVVIKFITGLDSQATFYTDANGREMLKRVRDYRPTWKLNQTEKTAGNFYPVNSRIYIRDEKANSQFTVLNDRSQGGSSIQDGSIEIMLHRRVLHDDRLGVQEPLNETGSDGNGLIVKGKLFVIFDNINNSARLHRPLSLQINNEPVCFIINLNGSNENMNNSKLNKYDRKLKSLIKLKTALPSNLHLLSMMQDYEYNTLNTTSLIIRLEHFYEKNEDLEFSKPVTFDLKQLFSLNSIKLLSVEELALGTNINIQDLNERLKWRPEKSEIQFDYRNYDSNKSKAFTNQDQFLYVFQPMQIRTFRITIDIS